MRKMIFWAVAVFITLAAVVFQRITGPTNPLKVEFSIDDNRYKATLLRSSETNLSHDQARENYKQFGKYSQVKIKVADIPDNYRGDLIYSLYPGNWESDTIVVYSSNNLFEFDVPSLPAASKIRYSFYVTGDDEVCKVNSDDIILRFKAPVPGYVLIPHILLMFLAMLLSNFIAVTSYLKSININRYVVTLLIVLGVGGLILGPIVQKFAFDAYWTGWPLGQDLTDNKTLFAFLVWLAAWLLNRKKGSKRYLYIIAAVIMLLVYSIPHSTAGSEYDHTKGEVVTGR